MGSLMRTDFCSFPPSPDSPSSSKVQFRSGMSRLPNSFSNQSLHWTGTGCGTPLRIISPVVRSPPTVVSSHIQTPLEKFMFGKSPPLAICFTNNSHSSSPYQDRDCLQTANQSSHFSVQKFIDGTQEISPSPSPVSWAMVDVTVTSPWVCLST